MGILPAKSAIIASSTKLSAGVNSMLPVLCMIYYLPVIKFWYLRFKCGIIYGASDLALIVGLLNTYLCRTKEKNYINQTGNVIFELFEP
jgi:hypothetical protein